MKRTFSFLVLSLLFIGCGALNEEEIARISIDQISVGDSLFVQETSIKLTKDDKIGIWSAMNLAYEGDVGFRFRVQILKNGEDYGGLEIDPTDKNITLGEVKTSIMGKTKWKFTGRNTSIEIPEDGEYTFRGILVTSDNPSLKVNQADLIFKK